MIYLKKMLLSLKPDLRESKNPLRIFLIVGGFLFLLLISSKPVKAAQTILQVEIPPQVIVSVEGQTIKTVFSNLGRLPKAKEISWKEQEKIVVPSDKLIQKFWTLSAALDWEKGRNCL
jgi:hypothetical protein